MILPDKDFLLLIGVRYWMEVLIVDVRRKDQWFVRVLSCPWFDVVDVRRIYGWSASLLLIGTRSLLGWSNLCRRTVYLHLFWREFVVWRYKSLLRGMPLIATESFDPNSEDIDDIANVMKKEWYE